MRRGLLESVSLGGKRATKEQGRLSHWDCLTALIIAYGNLLNEGKTDYTDNARPVRKRVLAEVLPLLIIWTSRARARKVHQRLAGQ